MSFNTSNVGTDIHKVNGLRASKFKLNHLRRNHLKINEPTLFRLKDRPIAVVQWQRYIEQEIGFVLPKEQSQWLLNAIETTATENNLSVAELWEAIKKDNKLNQQLLDTVLIPESRFFRHEPSIAFITSLASQYSARLSQNIIEDYANDSISSSNGSSTRLFRIWSVGCATGQEVWSLAMSLAAKNTSNYVLLGSDVSQRALTKARKGQYDQRQRRLIPSEYQHFTQPLAATDQNENPTYWRVVPELHEQVSFIWHNIFTQGLATLHLQQVIVCQNVLIYFRQFDQRDILTRLSAQCAIGGYIILAPGEALFWRPSNMRRIAHPQVNAWQKISA
ncbi:CheR family methyltransferase [Psychrobacter sp. FBL11]|uniref:CheR family methyltransferase n=1 Tax=Psychrobacter saeujeotis TaxID=3143436 RepID=A0ABU9X3X9_9GAMM|nr:CheR family methyltransferase [uncultured Psychrobacter sp.]